MQLGGQQPAGVEGNRRAEDERADHRVQADPLSHRGRCQSTENDDGERLGSRRDARAVAEFERCRDQPPQQRPHGESQHTDEGQEPDHRQAGSWCAARGSDRHDEPQECEGDDIVDRRTRHQERAEPAAEQTVLGQDPRQNGEGGPAHRHAEEQAERGERNVPSPDRRVRVVQRRGEHAHPEHEGQGDRAERDGGRPSPARPQRLRIELEADAEHEQHQPQLGHQPQVRHHGRREQAARKVMADEPEHARAEGDTGDDLAHHGRLADAAGDGTDDLGDDPDEGQAGEQAGE